MRIRQITFVLVQIAAFAGCASQRPLTAASAAALRGRNVAITIRRASPDFAAQTPGKAMFGILGAMAMISAGNDIIRENRVADPAPYIAQQLSGELARIHGTRATAVALPVGDEAPKSIASINPTADLIVDVGTINWSFIYFPLNWSHYRVIYSARLRIIDRKTAAVIAEGTCSRIPDDTPTAPSYDELLATGAERLKDELRVAANFCVGELRNKILAVGP
jgi:hypothetical protein